MVDVMLPTERLIDVVRAFDARFPTVKLRLHVEALSAVAQVVRNGAAMVGVGGGVPARESTVKSRVSANRRLAKPPTNGHFLAISGAYRKQAGLGGGGPSLQRTRLHIKFPDKQGINREFAVE